MALSRFQHEFTQALLADEAPADGAADLATLARQPGFAVHRNTVLKGCVDALQANYPAVARLVGEEWFRAAAAVFARVHLPTQPMLLHYGEGFASFLADFEPAAELTYLPGVARLDRYWTEAHIARDEPALAPDALAGLDAEELQDVILRPHASARWAWFDEQPVYSIWQHNRTCGAAGDSSCEEAAIAWRGEGALVVRPHDTVRWVDLGSGGCAFLDACAAGRTLAHAGAAALAAEPEADLAALGARLFAAGAFGPMRAEPVPSRATGRWA